MRINPAVDIALICHKDKSVTDAASVRMSCRIRPYLILCQVRLHAGCFYNHKNAIGFHIGAKYCHGAPR